MLSTSDRMRIVATGNTDEYRTVLERDAAAVPILSKRAAPSPGFPRNLHWIDYSSWRELPHEPSRQRGADQRRLCVAIGSRLCELSATLVARASGRSVVWVADQQGLSALFEKWSSAPLPDSLTWFCPLWEEPTERVTATWLREILAGMRGLAVQRELPNWGIITGLDAPALSRLAAKSVLFPNIAHDYGDEPVFLMNVVDPPGTPSPIVPLTWPLTRESRVFAFDNRGAALNGATAEDAIHAVEQRWSLAIFKAHGRSYCAARGFLCGAREAEESPLAPPRSCVLGMQCASKSWPQIDPRRYDTPILVLDACGSGHVESHLWADGIPSIAYKAIGGAPSAIVCSDVQTENAVGDFVDLAWGLARSTRIGEALRLINAVRRDSDGSDQPRYFLLGDPELPLESEHRPQLAAPARLAAVGRCAQVLLPKVPGPSVRAPYYEVADIESEQDAAVFLWAEGGTVQIQSARFFREGDRVSIWFGVEESSREGPASIFVQVGPRLSLPAGFVAEANQIFARTMCWAPNLDPARQVLVAAGMRAIAAGALLSQAAMEVLTNRPSAFSAEINGAVAAWLDAHTEAVRAVTSRAAGGIAPYGFWNVTEATRESAREACPYCGKRLAFEKRYRCYPLGHRRQTECLDCELINDRPEVAGFPIITLDVPDRIGRTRAVRAILTVDARACDVDWLGSAGVTVPFAGHALAVGPESASVTVQRGELRQFEFELTRRVDLERTTHRYRVRAVVLLNGLWFLGSRVAVVEN